MNIELAHAETDIKEDNRSRFVQQAGKPDLMIATSSFAHLCYDWYGCHDKYQFVCTRTAREASITDAVCPVLLADFRPIWSRKFR